MKLPGFLVSSAILFWGWQNSLMWAAAVLVLLLEAPRVLEIAVELSLHDFRRIAIACGVVFALLGLYLLFTAQSGTAGLIAVKWTPLIVAPFLLALNFSARRSVDVLALFRMPGSTPVNRAESNHAVQIGYGYFGICVLAASIGNRTDLAFLGGLILFTSWVLWCNRPTRRFSVLWVCLLCLVFIGGISTSSGLYRLQLVLEQSSYRWMSEDDSPDPSRVQTNLGHVGMLKLSDEILFRIYPAPDSRAPNFPMLLSTGAYNIRSHASWRAVAGSVFDEVAGGPSTKSGMRSWGLRPEQTSDFNLRISSSSKGGNALLALPSGTSYVASHNIDRLQQNGLRTFRAFLNARNFSYRVKFNSNNRDETSPAIEDSVLPARDTVLLKNIAAKLNLLHQPPEEVLIEVKKYFAGNFTYNLYREGRANELSEMEDFLVQNRSGHCEHFATATVLLLRAAGIPARYVVGYSVQEYSGWGNCYVARARDAHAWTRVYINGSWRDFDTTPADWTGAQSQSSSFLQSASDAFSWLAFSVREWISNGHQWVIYAAALLALAWVGRNPLRSLFRGTLELLSKILHLRLRKNGDLSIAPANLEFQKIELQLKRRGLGRKGSEPVEYWLKRIHAEIGVEAAEQLAQIARLHYQIRFGRGGVLDQQFQEFGEQCRDWISRHASPIRAGSPAGNRA